MMASRISFLFFSSATLEFVYPDRLELEVSIRESSGVVVDVVDAGRWASSGGVEGVLAGPLTTEGKIDDDVGSCEVGSDVAVGVGEVRVRSTLQIKDST